jgi:hypothetical protein
MARYDDLNTKMIAYAAVLSVVILVIILQLTQALCYNMVNSEDAKKESNKSDSAFVAKSEQLDSLNGFKRVSIIDESAEAPAKGQEPAMKKVIQIPVGEAQKLILKEWAGSPKPVPGT